MKRLSIILIPLILAACSTFAGVDLDTPKKKLVALEFTYQAALQSVDSLVTAGIIKGDSAKKVGSIIEKTGLAIRTARIALLAEDEGKFIQYLTIANTAILELTTYLAEKEKVT